MFSTRKKINIQRHQYFHFMVLLFILGSNSLLQSQDLILANYEMVLIKAGTFQMGSNTGKADEQPVHEVSISTFYLGKYEVTQKQWMDIMGSNPSDHSGCKDCPVESVSWNEVNIFISKLNEKTGLNFRLPTEAEWEYAAKGGRLPKGYRYSGSNRADDVAWYIDNSGYMTHPVGMKKPSELGLYDINGNVWEWTDDWTSFTYYRESPNENPRGPAAGDCKVLRGGAYCYEKSYLRLTLRGHEFPDRKFNNLGFRLAMTPEFQSKN